VVGYEMLTGGSPFGSEGDVLTQALVTTPRPLQEARPDTPSAVSAAIDRALIRDARQRLRTAAEFRDMLGADRAMVAAKPSRGARVGVTAAALVTVAGLAAFLLFPRNDNPLD